MDKLKPYLEAVSESAARVRKIIFVIITASVVFFIPEWNTLPSNWGSARLETAKAAIKYWGWHEEVRKGLKDADLDLFDRSRQFAEHLPALTTNEITAHIEKLENQKNYTVGIPVFGVTIQTNDLGIFCGFTFVVLLAMLRMSMARGLANLKMTFAHAEDKKEAYNLLCMQQVLTVPPDACCETPSRLWAWLTKSFIFLPLFVQLTIAWNDIATYQIGLILSPSATGITVLGNVLFLGFVIMLTFACLKLSVAYDEVFHDEYKKIHSPPPASH
jgi:hypothetical protein